MNVRVRSGNTLWFGVSDRRAMRLCARILAIVALMALTTQPVRAQNTPSAPAGLRFQAGPTQASPTQFSRPPLALPGTIQAEDFDIGGNGVAYWDSTAGNSGGQYRTADVDVERCAEGGYNVGWISSGEWLNYTLNVGSSGTYNFEFRVASYAGGTLHVAFNGQDRTGSVTVPATGGWQVWTTVRGTATLAAGSQVMRIIFDTGNINFNAVTVSAAAAPPSNGPFGGSARSLPGTVEAEDFDQGEPGVTYYDTSAGNTGGAYRQTDVDIQAIPSGGYTVGWAVAGEWTRYTVNVAAAGNYRVVARVASGGSGGTFHVEFGGVDRTGPIGVPNTGGWMTFQDVTATVWLNAGVQPMRLVLDSNGATNAVGNFTSIRVETPPAPPAGGGRLRVATWNIHFGGGDVWGQAQEIVNTGADVVLLQEASTYDEYMPTTYPDRLRQLTGQTWSHVWAGGEPCASGCQGILILSRLPIVDSSVATFTGAATARALIDVNGVRVNVFSLHLEYYDTSRRTTQLLQIMEWARQFAAPRIVGGDFNSWWGEWWIGQMETEYTDTWQDVTGSDADGYSLNGTVRFDYLFRSRDQNSRITPTACWVQVTTLSDHSPVVADYQVR